MARHGSKKSPVPQGGTGRSVPKVGKQRAVGGSGDAGRSRPPGLGKMGPKKGNP